jgi:hypothetical protein
MQMQGSPVLAAHVESGEPPAGEAKHDWMV